MTFVTSLAPDKDTLEVSLFGTGFGESLAVHLGHGDWMLVDSCKSKVATEPLSLLYLKSLGVDPAVAVKLIVVTHWHDDHVAGISSLVEQCESAEFVFSQALEIDEFRRLISLYIDSQITFDREKSGVKEMGDCLKILRSRKEAGINFRPIVRTQADHKLFRNADCEVVSLSPSPGAMWEAQHEIMALWQSLEHEAQGGDGPRPPRAAIPCPERNMNAVALWISHGEKRVLLGSDLEENGDPLLGWQAVLACKQFPDALAGVFKVSHHGSPNGDYAPVWHSVLGPEKPVSILTAFNRGRNPRPSVSDIQRIALNSDQVYYTSLPTLARNRYDRTVERTMSGPVKYRRALPNLPGHVQVRWEPSSATPAISLAGAAGKVP